jgi:hypothetical protein
MSSTATEGTNRRTSGPYRTSQIGVHQDDIKCLETNLRLQEDHIGEMTSELEVAMAEDCADSWEVWAQEGR